MPRQGKEGMVGRLSLLLFRSMPAILEEGVRRALSTDDDVTQGESTTRGGKEEGRDESDLEGEEWERRLWEEWREETGAALLEEERELLHPFLVPSLSSPSLSRAS